MHINHEVYMQDFTFFCRFRALSAHFSYLFCALISHFSKWIYTRITFSYLLHRYQLYVHIVFQVLHHVPSYSSVPVYLSGCRVVLPHDRGHRSDTGGAKRGSGWFVQMSVGFILLSPYWQYVTIYLGSPCIQGIFLIPPIGFSIK